MSPEEEGFTVKEILLRVEKKLNEELEDHETRIRSLERWKWGLPVSALGATLATLVALLHGGSPL